MNTYASHWQMTSINMHAGLGAGGARRFPAWRAARTAATPQPQYPTLLHIIFAYMLPVHHITL
jgi:hypothetical protein